MTQEDKYYSEEFGWWCSSSDAIPLSIDSLKQRLYQINQPVTVVMSSTGPALAPMNGTRCLHKSDDAALPVTGIAHSYNLESIGDPSFKKDWQLRFPMICGSMANGISSVDLVVAMANAGMTGFYGAAGQSLQDVETAVLSLKRRCPDRPWGINLIHSPQEPVMEEQVVDLLLKHHVTRIEASAYMTMTRALVRYRVHGIRQDENGKIITPNQILAKASRIEVATRFFSPPPESIIQGLVDDGTLTSEQAALCRQIPIATDVTAEADSGGHTDNRPLVTLLPSFLSLRRQLQEKFDYATPLRIGAAGGISTPGSVAAAFAMGAGWLVIGSIAQAAIESGSSTIVRQMLAQVKQAEIAMAPAADMFEMGVNVQVLKRGTLFPMRGRKLYEIYRDNDGFHTIPAKERQQIERTIFKASLESIWQETRQFWLDRDPAQIQRAETNPKHQMALTFRWYLGKSSRWANAGDPDRKPDYQVWCGPGMGAFNQWSTGSFLESPENRQIVTMTLNLLWGSAVICRAMQLRSRGIFIPQSVLDIEPQTVERINELIGSERIEQ